MKSGAMTSLFRKNFIFTAVIIISLLLLADIFHTVRNNRIIRSNQALQQQAETIKLYTEQIGKSTIHGIDIGLRGYALVQNAQFFSPVDSAFLRKDSILHNIETRLISQRYNQLSEFYTLTDSLNAYFNYCYYLKHLIDEKKTDEFIKHFSSDKGLNLWLQYIQCQQNIATFEDEINHKAQQRYEEAMRRNFILQIALFLICVPTLLYAAYYTRRTMALSDLLRETEAKNNKLLTEQNLMLEKMVAERTGEISSQRDTLAMQNAKLQEAQFTIEKQNQQLELEVDARTQELKHANAELIQQNNQLEQFAFIAAHNLRSPLAQLLGLANVLEYETDEKARHEVIGRMISSTRDLDLVIRDLNTILDVRKHSSLLETVSLTDTLKRVTKTLEREIELTQASLAIDFQHADHVTGVSPYVESILYNLLSNAIKYRHADRAPVLSLKTQLHNDHVLLTVADNGLGIDLKRHHGNIFGLYKRFHEHTEGRGLGLYLIKTQLTSMGGTVKVESEPEKGTTFFLQFRK